MRFGLSAAAAAAVLYGAVVLLGLGPGFPVALGRSHARGPSVVRVQAHDSVVSGPAQRGPQPSPGPARHRASTAARVRVRKSATKAAASPRRVPHRRPPDAAHPAAISRPPAAPSPSQSQPVELAVPLPDLPAAPPQLTPPVTTVPTVTLPALPPPLPQLPPLPPTPPLPLP